MAERCRTTRDGNSERAVHVHHLEIVSNDVEKPQDSELKLIN